MSTLFQFPGQGAQRPGLLHALPVDPEVRRTLEEAAKVLEADPLSLDTAHALEHTRAVQLCLLIAGVATARLLLNRGPAPQLVAGLSIGAYAAAVVAEALDFADALRLVARRGELMQTAYPKGYGMLAILGLDRATVEGLVADHHRPEAPIYLANANAEQQYVVAGNDAGLAVLSEAARTQGAAAAKRLAMSVPSHCPLLAEAAQTLNQAFAEVELRAPRLAYLSGTSARRLVRAEQLRDDLAFNMARPIEWHATLEAARERGVRLAIELAPGSVLSQLARRVLPPAGVLAWQDTHPETLDALRREEAARLD
ncbi:malonate decarboxylase subunit epsilon [Pseudomonas oryzihabitans]|uniref:Malonyl CoA-acyl carrier protein transacylase n=1 Tax=Pseudomonas oryzihabitans TaxID=47885 RepID=A0A0U4WA86_9PSED|nr:malonate decarboxylase subunit epsilon [Pseudomonas oryzihabitans]ALZ84885.1 malonate decarboxylase subunit epsilon [Pseudomonas oryzihabitans]